MRTLVVWMLLAGAAAAQGVVGSVAGGLPQNPPRDPRAQMQTGSGSIAGRVTAADSGMPLRRVMVNLGGLRRMQGTYTDDEGRYEFPRLPSGTYTVFANPGPQRAGYQPASYGATFSHPSTARGPLIMAGKPIDLADSQRLENIDIALPPTAVITGRVTDALGEPAARVSVAALSLRGSEPAMAGRAETNDLGEFRIFNLPPGEYVVRVDTGSRFSGGQIEMVGETVGYTQTYAPGTASIAAATRLRLGRGTQATADLRLVETSVYTVSGIVLRSGGNPSPGGNVTLARTDMPDGPAFHGPVTGAGAFTVHGVPPGSYQVIGRVQSPPQPEPAANASRQEFGTVQVEVMGEHVENVVVITRPGATVTGTFVFEEPLPRTGRVSLNVIPAERRNYLGTPIAEVAGGQFTIRDLFGPVLVRGNASGGPATWGLKAVLLRGKDITDEPRVLTAADSGHLQVVFTSNAPALDGVVTDDVGRPVSGAVVVLFGHDPEGWKPHSSFNRTARPGKDGKFILRGLREGRYYAVALAADAITTVSQPSAEFLKGLSQVATAVTLNAGETRTVDLPLVRVEWP